jgi:acyl-CoA oxidase
LQQHRLLPYLAGVYVLQAASSFLMETILQFTIDSVMGKSKESQAELGMELHVVSSASKPVAGWFSKEAIQECREACGGHGYLRGELQSR